MDQVLNLDAIFNKYGFPVLMVFFFVVSFNPSIKMITELIIDLSKQINSYQNTNLALIHAMHQLQEGNIDVAKKLIESAEADAKLLEETTDNIIKKVSQRNEGILAKLKDNAAHIKENTAHIKENAALIKGKTTEVKEESK